MTITVYVGSPGEYLANIAKQNDPHATLITSKNFQNLKSGTYYTSVGDLSNLVEFGAVLRQADVIRYFPDDDWKSSNHCLKHSIQYWTEKYLLSMHCDPCKIVQGFSPAVTIKSEMLRLPDIRKTNDKQIWIAGCSISHGIGVADNERYGNLIAQDLKQSVSFLTSPGSSIRWASDQILRSDIRCEDTVFWGITSPTRFSGWDESQENVKFVTLNNFKKLLFSKDLITLDFLTGDHSIYESLVAVHNVCNFCIQNNVKLILATLLEGTDQYLTDLDNFISITNINGQEPENMFLDHGYDKEHPGPITHQYYATKMLAKYHQIYS